MRPTAVGRASHPLLLITSAGGVAMGSQSGDHGRVQMSIVRDNPIHLGEGLIKRERRVIQIHTDAPTLFD